MESSDDSPRPQHQLRCSALQTEGSRSPATRIPTKIEEQDVSNYGAQTAPIAELTEK